MSRYDNLLHPTWPVERDALLRQLWQMGLSINLIAGSIGGISRNAVAGRRRRLKLPGRPSPIHRAVNDNAVAREIAA